MRTIYKFSLRTAERQTLQLPTGAALLSVQAQREVPTLWAIVDLDQPLEDRTIVTRGTGVPFANGECGCYLGTVQFSGYPAPVVFHYFEEG